MPAVTWKTPSKSKQLVQWLKLTWNRREMRQWSIAKPWLRMGGSGTLQIAIRCSGFACRLAVQSVLMLMIVMSTFLLGHDMLELKCFLFSTFLAQSINSSVHIIKLNITHCGTSGTTGTAPCHSMGIIIYGKTLTVQLLLLL